MKCACNRWGPGTTKERLQDTQNMREINSKMEQLMLERSSQENYWKPNIANISSTVTRCDASLLPVEATKQEEKYKCQVPQNIRFWN